MKGPDYPPDRTEDTDPARLFGVPFAWILPIILALLGALICGVISFLGAYWDVDVSRLSFGDALSRVLIFAAGPIIGALGGIVLGILLANSLYDFAPIWWLVYLPGLASYGAIGILLGLNEGGVAVDLLEGHELLMLGLATLPVLGFIWAVRLYRRQVPIKTCCGLTLTTYALVGVFLFFFGFPNI